MIPFTFDYVSLAVCLCCMAFFVKGARLDEQSPLAWGGLSLAGWLAATWLLSGGLLMCLASQGLLFVGLAAFNARRDRIRQSARDQA